MLAMDIELGETRRVARADASLANKGQARDLMGLRSDSLKLLWDLSILFAHKEHAEDEAAHTHYMYRANWCTIGLPGNDRAEDECARIYGI